MENKNKYVQLKSGVFALIIIMATLLVAIFTSAFTFIYTKSLYDDSTGKLSFSSSDEDMEKYEVLEEVYDTLDEMYIRDLDTEEMVDQAIKGLVYGTGDVYATYFTKEEYGEFVKEDKGEYVGIGVLINIGDYNQIIVAQVYADSPADKGGIQSGDIIIGVDGESIIGVDYQVVVDKVRGEAGTDVSITVDRNGEAIDLLMVRSEIIAEQAEWHMVDDEVGYIKIREFSGNASELFHQGLDELIEQGAKGFILDLRNNPGGSKDLVCEIGDTLFPKGEIITLIDSAGNRDTDYSDADFLDMPLVTLINGGSASASELLSGGIQDYGVGTLVGETTFGKGVAQSFHYIKDGGTLRVTSSYYETAGGNCPQDVGITPDYEVILDEEVQNDQSLLTTEKDNQFQKAMELLKEEIG